MTTYIGWTPPPGVAVVEPPVNRNTTVLTMWNDGFLDDDPVPAGELNWTAVGDGPSIVAYSVVQEYKPAPELWEGWIKPTVNHPRIVETELDRPHAYIHVREVPDPSRDGMSLRDWFAGQAIHAALSAAWDADMTIDQNASVAASWSYAIADAMMKASK